MPPVGSWSTNKGAGFSFPRPYISWFEWFVNPDNDTISFDGSVFTIGSHGFPNIVQYVKIKEGWWDWDTRGFRLHELVTNYWYVISPSPTEHANAGLAINFLFDDDLHSWGVQFQKESPVTHLPYPIEREPSSYWLFPLPPLL